MGRESGPKPKHAVIVLLDDRKNVGHVGVRRLDRPARWETVWRLKDQIDTPLAHWLRTLDRKPREVVLVGSLGLGGRTARAIVALVAGWFGQENPLSNAGRRGRPTAQDRTGRHVTVLAVPLRCVARLEGQPVGSTPQGPRRQDVRPWLTGPLNCGVNRV